MNLFEIASAPLNREANSVTDKYAIGESFVKKLNEIKNYYKIVFICDDTYSMNKLIKNSQTKWNEQKKNMSILLDIVSAYNVDCDVFFLNRPGLKNVAHIIQLNDHYETLPSEAVIKKPFTKVLNNCLENSINENDDKSLLIVMFIEGSPSSEWLSENDAIKEFKYTLQTRRLIEQVFVSLVIINEDYNSVKYLENWDSMIQNVDIIFDYEKERLKQANLNSYGDYASRILSFFKPNQATDEKIIRLKLIENYDLSYMFSEKLDQLKHFKIVCLCDDSTSMIERLKNGETKWNELKNNIEILLDITSAHKVNTCVSFLNRPGFTYQRKSQISQSFTKLPKGSTSITSRFHSVLEENINELNSKNLLVIIFIDGCPSSNYLSTKDAIKEFKNALTTRNPPSKIFVTIVSVNEDLRSLHYLKDWDEVLTNFSIVYDFQNEKNNILTKSNIAFSLTRGDYIAKILLSSFINEIKNLGNRNCSSLYYLLCIPQ
jgi:hypothetical protein